MSAAADCIAAVREVADMARTPGISTNADDIESTGKRMRLLCDMEREDDFRHLREALKERDPLEPTRDLFDLSKNKCVLLLDAMRIYVTREYDRMSMEDQRDCVELLAQIGVAVK